MGELGPRSIQCFSRQKTDESVKKIIHHPFSLSSSTHKVLLLKYVIDIDQSENCQRRMSEEFHYPTYDLSNPSEQSIEGINVSQPDTSVISSRHFNLVVKEVAQRLKVSMGISSCVEELGDIENSLGKNLNQVRYDDNTKTVLTILIIHNSMTSCSSNIFLFDSLIHIIPSSIIFVDNFNISWK